MEQVALNTDDFYQTDMPVGEVLRRARMHYGQSLTDIERALRIKAPLIEAIENSDFDSLPGKVYTIGFIRSYSEYLGLDGAQMIKLFKQQAGAKTHDPELHFPVSADDSKIPSAWLIGASVVAAVLVLMVWTGVQNAGRELVDTVPSVEEEFSVTENAEPYGPFMPEDIAPAAAPDPEPVQRGITLKITKNSWVEIKDQEGKKIVSRVLEVGDEYFVPDRPDLTMSLGNAGGVQIEIDGQSLSGLGGQGDVLRDLPLDIEYLKKNFSGES